MGRIKQLSPAEAQKIAAGEVVERPANVVKELVENSIDAGATSISIYVVDGGKEQIRIVDNGCGMSYEDAHACFLHHATSKIESVDQLNAITTFGFRGEALSSIAAVSKVTLITREHTAAHGTRIEIAASQISSASEVAAAHGTDITINELFYNVPARKKFLKTKETEWRQITSLFQALCFDYRSIHFSLYADNALVHNCPPVPTLVDRVRQLWDSNAHTNIIPLEAITDRSITIHGAISSYHYSKYDRSSIFFFVNNRWVKNHKLATAFCKGYLNAIPTDRFPAGCIFVDIPGDQVDINIHPRKEEVQFLHPRLVEQLITAEVKKTLEQHLSDKLKKQVTFAPASSLGQESRSVGFVPHRPLFHPILPSFVETITPKISNPQISAPLVTQSQIQEIIASDPFEPSPERQISLDPAPSHEEVGDIIGQLHKTYILIETEAGLYLVDQHAAHERILYEQFKQRFDQVEKVTLLFPVIINTPNEAIELIEPYLDLLIKTGIDIDRFGTNQLVVHATPVHLKNISIEELVHEMIGWISQHKTVHQTEIRTLVHERLHAQMACKAAVKAGDTLSPEQMKQLLKDLAVTDNRFTCPHGRPTGWLIPLGDIEKRFKRDYK